MHFWREESMITYIIICIALEPFRIKISIPFKSNLTFDRKGFYSSYVFCIVFSLLLQLSKEVTSEIEHNLSRILPNRKKCTCNHNGSETDTGFHTPSTGLCFKIY